MPNALNSVTGVLKSAQFDSVLLWDDFESLVRIELEFLRDGTHVRDKTIDFMRHVDEFMETVDDVNHHGQFLSHNRTRGSYIPAQIEICSKSIFPSNLRIVHHVSTANPDTGVPDFYIYSVESSHLSADVTISTASKRGQGWKTRTVTHRQLVHTECMVSMHLHDNEFPHFTNDDVFFKSLTEYQPADTNHLFALQVVRQMVNFMIMHNVNVGFIATDSHMRFICRPFHGSNITTGNRAGNILLSKSYARCLDGADEEHQSSLIGYILGTLCAIVRGSSLWSGYRSLPIHQLFRDKYWKNDAQITDGFENEEIFSPVPSLYSDNDTDEYSEVDKEIETPSVIAANTMTPLRSENFPNISQLVNFRSLLQADESPIEDTKELSHFESSSSISDTPQDEIHRSAESALYCSDEGTLYTAYDFAPGESDEEERFSTDETMSNSSENAEFGVGLQNLEEESEHYYSNYSTQYSFLDHLNFWLDQVDRSYEFEESNPVSNEIEYICYHNELNESSFDEVEKNRFDELSWHDSDVAISAIAGSDIASSNITSSNITSSEIAVSDISVFDTAVSNIASSSTDDASYSRVERDSQARSSSNSEDSSFKYPIKVYESLDQITVPSVFALPEQATDLERNGVILQVAPYASSFPVIKHGLALPFELEISRFKLMLEHISQHLPDSTLDSGAVITNVDIVLAERPALDWFEMCKSDTFTRNQGFVPANLELTILTQGVPEIRIYTVVAKRCEYSHSQHGLQRKKQLEHELSIYKYLGQSQLAQDVIPKFIAWGDVWNTHKMLIMEPWGRALGPLDLDSEVIAKLKVSVEQLNKADIKLRAFCLEMFSIGPDRSVRVADLRFAKRVEKLKKVDCAEQMECLERMIQSYPTLDETQ